MESYYMSSGRSSDLHRRRGWRRYFIYDELIWLVYLGFWFIQPYYDHFGLRQWVWLAVAIVLFISFFMLAHRGPRRFRWIWSVAMLILGMVYVPINQSACGIFVFLAATLAELSETPSVVFYLLIGESLIVTGESWLLHLTLWVWGTSVGLLLVMGVNRVRMTQKWQADAKLRMAHDEIEKLAKTAERERIARDMHDVLGHSLSLIVLKSELAGHLIGSEPSRAALEIKEIEDTARGALAEVRRTLTGYRSEGFTAELTKAAKVLEAAGVHVNTPEKPPVLTARHEATLSMVLREAVTNIVRHAKASECSIELSSAKDTTHLIIADNGRGNIREEGNGLRGMRERVQELGGRLLLESSRGTRLQIELPQLDALSLEQ
jgi:two-component system sensor histidine kinase DesK